MRLLAICVVACGCASQIQRVPIDWDRASDPQCTESYDNVIADAVVAAAATAGSVTAASSIRGPSGAAVSIVLGVTALGFAVSGAIGHGWVVDCQQATEAWRIARATSAVPNPQR